VHYLQLFASSLFLVTCKAFQQENVLHRHWRLIPPTSYVFAAAELVLLHGGYRVITSGSLWVGALGVLSLGTGAWLGCYLAMFIHDRMR